jgi:hypothetical protein
MNKHTYEITVNQHGKYSARYVFEDGSYPYVIRNNLDSVEEAERIIKLHKEFMSVPVEYLVKVIK